MIQLKYAARYAEQIQADIEVLDIKAMQLRAKLRKLSKNSYAYKSTAITLRAVYDELLFMNKLRTLVKTYNADHSTCSNNINIR